MQYSQKLESLEKHFEELNLQMADHAIISDGEQYRKVSKSRSDMEEVVGKYREYKQYSSELAQAKEMMADSDPDM